MMAKMGVINRSSTMVVVLAIALIVILSVTYMSVEVQSMSPIMGGGSTPIYSGTARIATYCNIEAPARPPHNESLTSSWALQYLAMNIRHGDRSSIHKIPGTDSTTGASSSKAPTPLDNRTTDYIEKLKSFKLLSLPGSKTRFNFEKNEERDLKSALNPKKTLQKAGTSLPPGQLTTRGFSQHIELGKLMHKLYGPSFLSKVLAAQMYVRSTNYARTVQSVSALLITMMPHLNNWKRRIPINYFANEEDEIMHGLGVRSTSHTNTTTGTTSATPGKSNVEEEEEEEGKAETVSSGGCAASVRLAALQDKAFVLDPSLRSELVNRLGNQVKDKPVGHMADALLPSYCHDRPLPCSAVEDKVKEGSGGPIESFLRGSADSVATAVGGQGVRGSHCLNTNDLAMIMAEADRQYCERFAGDQGGLNSTKLSIFPFLREVTQHVTTAALQGEHRKERLSVFSGHDTVIAPVLAGLGVYSGDLCIWPGYASNIVVELWQPKVKSDSAAAGGSGSSSSTGPSPSVQKLYPELWQSSKPSRPAAYAESFVRVFFNGQDVTQRVPTCAAERGLLSSPISDRRVLVDAVGAKAWDGAAVRHKLLGQAVAEGLTLCSLEALLEQVASLVEPHASIAYACLGRNASVAALN